jgi:hypothetical protein
MSQALVYELRGGPNPYAGAWLRKPDQTPVLAQQVAEGTVPVVQGPPGEKGPIGNVEIADDILDFISSLDGAINNV